MAVSTLTSPCLYPNFTIQALLTTQLHFFLILFAAHMYPCLQFVKIPVMNLADDFFFYSAHQIHYPLSRC